MIATGKIDIVSNIPYRQTINLSMMYINKPVGFRVELHTKTPCFRMEKSRKKNRLFLRLDLENRKKITLRRDLCKSKNLLALTHWVGRGKIGEYLLSQDIHSVLHNRGVKIKIFGCRPHPLAIGRPPGKGTHK